MSQRIIYFDNASTTQIREDVIKKIVDTMKNCYGNPSSTHSYGRNARTNIEKARKNIAQIINAKPSEIIFTSGGTEGNNMVLQGCVQHLGINTIITSRIEHHSVLSTVNSLKKIFNIQVLYVNILKNGQIDLQHLEELLIKTNPSSNKLVSLMHVNNEIGNITDIMTVGKLCEQYGALFHSDAIQSVGHFHWNVKDCPIHFITATAHKIHGPKGIGFAYINKDIKMQSLIWGGKQERGLRAGTESTSSIVGLEACLTTANENMKEEMQNIQALKSYFIEQTHTHLPNCVFNGLSEDINNSLYTLVNVCFPDIPKDKALMMNFHLDMKGIACSKGSACQSGSTTNSHVLTEFLPHDLVEKPSIRFSFSKYNTKEEVDFVIKCLSEFIAS